MTALQELAAASRELGALHGRRQKIERIAALLRTCSDSEAATVARWMTGEPAQARLGIGPAQVHTACTTQPASSPRLTVGDVVAWFREIGTIKGGGSKAARADRLARLFAAATEQEQQFLAHLLLGELRQGALLGLVIEAIASAFALPLGSIQRAHMLTGEVGEVAAVARTQGRAGVDAIELRLFHPVQPMLAQPAEDLGAAIATLGEPLLEYKLDGARVQVHKQETEVRVFSRQGNDVTEAVPDIVEPVRRLPVSDLVLDGEALAFGDDGTPRPFQTSMRRFGRRSDDAALRAQLPLQSFYFDCLRLNGETLIDADTLSRQAALRDVVPASLRMPSLRTTSDSEAKAFLEQALAAGHEGLMAKAPQAPYAAGGRGSHWLKIKQIQTLDLVVLAAEWGSGRRQGWLSNLHLGARSNGGFVMLGKTFKGLTDQLLTWQTEQLLAREIARQGIIVQVRPELVVEIAFNELQRSRQYPAGLALRFARVRRYRDDKTASEADDIETVSALFARQVAYRDVLSDH
ncbi:MAG: ATP-dependent DNA ligase, partial [Gammaproteobacteria bacterium]|nr:ATP-dependent DNA ligase [Gammaproteobacteria bacterium]